MQELYIYIFLLFVIVFCFLKRKKKNNIEKLTNLSTPSIPQTVMFQRYARYDPYNFPYPLDDCYLGIHHNGSLIRAHGRENWNSMQFELIPADMGHYFIKSVGIGSYLYLDDNNIPTTQHPDKLTQRYKWEITVDQLGNVIIWNPHIKRFLAMSCKDDIPYSRVEYHNDCLFKAIIIR